MKVAFAGAAGAFGEEAARNFGEPVARADFAAVFDAVERAEVELGVVPVENSHAGIVAESYDLLRDRGLFVSAALVLPVRHCLLAPKGVDPDTLSEARSHPQALAQCAEFLESRGLEPIADSNTAAAAKAVAEGKHPRAFAIASRAAAEAHGLEIVAEDIQDAKDNATRFFAIARRPGTGGRALLQLKGDQFSAVLGAGLALAHVHSRPRGTEQVVFAEVEGRELLRLRAPKIVGQFDEIDLRGRNSGQ